MPPGMTHVARKERKKMDLIVPTLVGVVFLALLAYYVVILVGGDHE